MARLWTNPRRLLANAQIRKVLETVATRYLVAFLNLVLLFVNAKVLGAEGLGLVGIILASMNLAVIFNSIFCGSTIVYFMNRYGMKRLVAPAYLWAVAGSAVATGVMAALGLFPLAYAADVYFLALLNSLIAANSRFLLGADRVGGFNLVFFLQSGLLFFVLLFYYYIWEKPEVASYLQGLYITNGAALAVSFLLLRRKFAEKESIAVSRSSLLREMFVYGLWSNVDNLAETLSSRLNYFLVQRFVGLSGVGLLDGGTKISESVWHISRAVGYIVNGEVARSHDAGDQRQTTLRLLRLTFGATSAVMLVILCIPEWVYTDYLFSAEFAGIANVIRCLAPGIVALACNTILSQYFIGSGRVKDSAYASCTGLAVLAVAGGVMVPLWGVSGGAGATSVAFGAMLAVSWAKFRKAK